MALTHRSFNSHKEAHYERLEYLGDRVLGLVLSHWLFDQFPESDQGEMSKKIHIHACQEMLAHICKIIGLQTYIRCGKSDGHVVQRPSIQSDVVESVIAALYLDGGLAAAQEFIYKHWDIHAKHNSLSFDNAKSQLQEWTATQNLPLPVYHLVRQTGQDHAPEFFIQLDVHGFECAKGQGHTRKIAERHAARVFLDRYVCK